MFSFFLAAVSCRHFAVLFAGSKGWSNYRHQADICTLYGLLLQRGYDASDIIMMQYDDIANSASNPFKGQVFHTLSHDVNVYPGSDAMTYRGEDCTSKNFINVLTTLPTTSEDYVFIYYDNHGGPDLLADPTGGYIRTTDLANALSEMYINNLYKYCLFGIEACYSGSLAEQFTVPNMAIITAANEKESSYSAVMDDTLHAYLTNEFSNHWFNQMDSYPTQTIGQLYLNLKSLVLASHVMYYGDERMKQLTVDNFFGTKSNSIKSVGLQHEKFDTAPQRVATEFGLDWIDEMESKQPLMAPWRGKYVSLRKKLEAETIKLNNVLDTIVRRIDNDNYEQIMNDTTAPMTREFQRVLDVFLDKFGEMNPDDFGRLMVLKALAAKHPFNTIIEVIEDVL
ncbi:Clan CD, family C13, asparaginyl endopeptidase-like cysteine peptidase [Histomonas meleagridis]|uniref:Clan CD, family C13, asparaginyl endopeptidase-like cysteine peptidase n=1 Tax=Histomonas meleagridis TaxID=135588 RepID=UPI00355A7DFE|nr:Clan CD, family C13, asparaginyl endopeptidase-like cysteine peptidase [Histomonas meleagridis]KAH0800695.1 Clan CD, family C13, asparaginyl endopeptidase-like cysteine peptidase [Histomonas meleagridis]